MQRINNNDHSKSRIFTHTVQYHLFKDEVAKMARCRFLGIKILPNTLINFVRVIGISSKRQHADGFFCWSDIQEANPLTKSCDLRNRLNATMACGVVEKAGYDLWRLVYYAECNTTRAQHIREQQALGQQVRLPLLNGSVAEYFAASSQAACQPAVAEPKPAAKRDSRSLKTHPELMAAQLDALDAELADLSSPMPQCSDGAGPRSPSPPGTPEGKRRRTKRQPEDDRKFRSFLDEFADGAVLDRHDARGHSVD